MPFCGSKNAFGATKLRSEKQNEAQGQTLRNNNEIMRKRIQEKRMLEAARKEWRSKIECLSDSTVVPKPIKRHWRPPASAEKSLRPFFFAAVVILYSRTTFWTVLPFSCNFSCGACGLVFSRPTYSNCNVEIATSSERKEDDAQFGRVGFLLLLLVPVHVLEYQKERCFSENKTNL